LHEEHWPPNLRWLDEARRTITVLDCVPTAQDPAAPHYASKQHHSWIAEYIKNSITSTVRATLDAYEEDHDGDGIVLFFCFLQEFLGATREALVLAEEALNPMKLRLSNFNQDVKAFTLIVSFFLGTFRALVAKFPTGSLVKALIG
jgi:hypothetical protein